MVTAPSASGDGPCGGGSGPCLAAAGPPSGPRPTFPSTVTTSVPPPAISGGTLLVTSDGNTAIAADPDRDAIYVVDVQGMTVRSTIALKAGDEPGRLAEDGEGRVHVALRGSGAVLTIDPTNGTVLARTTACPAPRGVAWDPGSDGILVACATGELVTLPSSGGAAASSVHLQDDLRDLRDVIVQNGAVAVTSFRAAQVLRVSSDRTSVASTNQLPAPDMLSAPQVVWRAVAGAQGSIIAVHQAESSQSIATKQPGGYGGGGPVGFGGFTGGFTGSNASALPPLIPPTLTDEAGVLFEGDAGQVVTPFVGSGSAVTSVLTILDSSGTVLLNRGVSGVLPVDVAVSADGNIIAGVTPGSAFTAGLSDFFVISDGGHGQESDQSLGPNVQPTAVAFDANGHVLMQSREPATLWVVPLAGGSAASIQLSATSRDDTGHDVFHTQAGAQIACASCHPEGGDDGHIWVLDGNQRRTPSLRGTIAGTAPYHWPGDQPNLETLVNDVYTVRMSGATLASDQMGALTGWVQTIPKPPAPSWVDLNAANLGHALFQGDAACAKCHDGTKFTNNATVDVGTGGAFQVPPLVGVGWRTPLMHDGCAATIADRFGKCATPTHGNISYLSSQDVANLTAYLQTL